MVAILNPAKGAMKKINAFIKKIFNSKSSHFYQQNYPELQNYPSVGGYVFWHNRATDVVLIGPFATLDSAWKWYASYGEPLGVTCTLTHTRYPANTYNGIWGLMPEEQDL